MEGINHLSSNIRYLRKQRKMSQQALAEELDIRRSNIAAYETKNVEPKLLLIYRMAEFFDVSLSQFIKSDLATLGEKRQGFRSHTLPEQAISSLHGNPISMPDSVTVAQFQEQSLKIRKMLEGFRVFYQFRRKVADENQQHSIQADVENFLIFIDHMLQYNERVITLLGSPGASADKSMPSVTNEVNAQDNGHAQMSTSSDTYM